MKNKSKNFFDKISSRSSRERKKLRGTALKTIEAARRHLSSGQEVLDFGCGTGDLTLAIAEIVKSVQAIDTSPGMVEVAQAKASDVGNVKFTNSSIDDVRRSGDTFHIVTAFNVLHYVEDIEADARRVGDLLSPGGLFISSTACLGERISFLGLLVLTLGKLRIMPEMTFFKKSELEKLVSSGGFQIIETVKLSRLPEYFIVAKKKEGK
jgi:2-polyprenyl-3-methyl-5-hydroxy-6-metoxy-1,4-benzoquinol methylase